MDKNKIILGVIVALLVVGIGITLVMNRGRNDDVIKIGAILPLTGGAAEFGTESRNAIQLFVDLTNNNGGINGRKIQLIIEDGELEPKKAISALKKLVEIDRVEYVITCFSQISFPVAEHLSNRKPPIVHIASHVSPIDFIDISPWSFRVNQSSLVEAQAFVDYLVKKKNRTRVAVYYSNDDFGNTFRRSFLSCLQESGGTIVYEETFERGQQDHRNAIAQMRASSPDICLFLGNDHTVAHAIRQARQTGLNVDVAITLAVASKANLDIAGDAVNGLYCCIAWFDAHKTESAQAMTFDADYTKRYGEPPSFYAAYPYAAMTVLAEGIRRSPSGKPEEVRSVMMQITEFDTVAGVVSATDKGDFPLLVEIMRWDGKIFVQPD